MLELGVHLHHENRAIDALVDPFAEPVFWGENFTNEGLDRILDRVPRNAASLDATLYLAAITTAGTVEGTTALTATTVPNRLTVWLTDYQTGGSGRGGGGEPTIATGAYARVSMASTVWGAGATNGNGRRSTATQQSFAQSSAAWSNQTVVGFGIVTASTAGAGVAYSYANFDDSTSVAINAAGIVLQITPYWQLDI